MNSVLRHLRRAALLDDGGGLTDGQLLEGFLARHDEAAFAALVRRHGPMILGVCRRLLRQEQDAEDAFQATFLVLARKAASIRPREVVGNWLYGVACRTAMKARTMNARRRQREGRAGIKATAEAPSGETWDDLLPLLDQELSRLPDKYRVPVVLCDLQGRTRREVAAQLKVPEGTLSGRLTTARRMLARRLARYGLAVSGGALAAALSEKAASACVTMALATSTARAAALVAAGQGLTAGAVPARVVALAEGVVKTMLLTKLRAFVAVAVVVTVSAGVVGLAYRTTAAEPKRAAAQPAADELEELRLEVEALRKGLQATRARVKVLEAEVELLKGTGRPSPQPPVRETVPQPPGRGALPSADPPDLAPQEGAASNPDADARQPDPSPRGFPPATRAPQPSADWDTRPPTEKTAWGDDPFAEVKTALKKLRQYPEDTQQAEKELDRALQRLKERALPAGTVGSPPKS
jgi:RNA polymerase sigma factor (sigma-70 family)